ncbi:MAG: protoporphyrinogen oxidase HemJ [Pseudomonadota bacterium]|nr:protoporphyrinogen oxidase HemJ [Pseudomonadota bacterium]
MLGLTPDVYLWIKALHIISVIAWMAGLLYLPRLFVYHVDAAVGSELSETLKIMERRLLKLIMNPAMIFSFLFGAVLLLDLNKDVWQDYWLYYKLFLVFCLLSTHIAMAKWQKNFVNNKNTQSKKFFRILNEVPTILMICIVILVTLRPF